MILFIAPPEPTVWRISPSELMHRLEEGWGDCEVRIAGRADRRHVVEWEYAVPDPPLQGALARDGQVVRLAGDVTDLANFAVWFRRIVPERQELVIFDEGHAADLRLDGRTTAEAIIDMFKLPGSQSR